MFVKNQVRQDKSMQNLYAQKQLEKHEKNSRASVLVSHSMWKKLITFSLQFDSDEDKYQQVKNCICQLWTKNTLKLKA